MLNEKLINQIKGEEYSFIVENSETQKFSQSGIKPIMMCIDTQKELLLNANVYDKIVGKAAALLLTMCGVKAVYGKIMSQKAIEVLTEHKIEYKFDVSVEYIINRKGDGMCPMEETVLNINDEKLAYTKLKEKIALLSKAK